ncbi:MAG: SNF1-interacting protein [Candelina mexicana]|nr:MAG: SNF1-interacting protein [Candelina mexicana]
MGNSSTKESRPPPTPSQSHMHSFRRPSLRPLGSAHTSSTNTTEHLPSVNDAPRHGRGSRPELSLLGLGEREVAEVEPRRETKQEREARRTERERAAREAERARSIREESVDGGYLVTQGVYIGTEDYNKAIVRQLMIERRVAPFWKGLNDHSVSWTEHQLVAAAMGLPIPAPDEIPALIEESSGPSIKHSTDPKSSDSNIANLTVPISSRSQSYNSDTSMNLSPTHPGFSVAQPPSPMGSPPSNSPLFRGRSKTLASLTTPLKNTSQADMTPREVALPKDPYVHGQRIEAYLYKDAMECPICFLYYPPYLNKTRCCDQAICSECFVQIKRPDPHPPEHSEPTSPTRPTMELREPHEDGALVCEPACCPFCVQPEFGITYDPPSFRRGLSYANHPSTHPLANAASAMSSSSSLSSGGMLAPQITARRRTMSLSVDAANVITTDKIRPDWATKLAGARAHAARRSAAATALHTAAYLMGNGSGSDGRGFAGFGRRGRHTRGSADNIYPMLGSTGNGDGSTGGSFGTLAAMAERHGASVDRGDQSTYAEAPRRRSRTEDLEEMMLLEAIRLSLASEEERKKKEEKEEKKKAKKREKENKKAEKAAKKGGLYAGSGNDSASAVETPMTGGSRTSSVVGDTGPGKGKGKVLDPTTTPQANRIETSARVQSSLATDSEAAQEVRVEDLLEPPPQMQPSNAQQQISQNGTGQHKMSQLRQVSNTSSSASSFVESAPGSLRHGLNGSSSSFDASPNTSGLSIAQGSIRSSTPPGGNAGTEPMFNFRSLAAMIDNEDRGESPSHYEHRGTTEASRDQDIGQSFGKIPTTLGTSPGSDISHLYRQEPSNADDSPTSSIYVDAPDLTITAASTPDLRPTSKRDEKHVGGIEVIEAGGHGRLNGGAA